VSRPFAFSVRRELWEHRAVHLAPLVVAGLTLAAFALGANRLQARLADVVTLAPERQAALLAAPFGLAASAILLTGFLVGAFYCLDALNAERRDRSILFWKSLPVSDRTTVLSKFTVPMLVQPVVAYLVAVVASCILLVATLVGLALTGAPVGALWSRLPFFTLLAVMLYGVVAHALWYAPIYAWLLLVSAWARRATLLWAALPVVVAIALEAIAFGTRHFLSLVRYRLGGALDAAFLPDASDDVVISFADLDPVGFLSTPGLWLGLGFAAACLAAAVRLRRVREPL
jgi:ABC-2 type transport system permease protein